MTTETKGTHTPGPWNVGSSPTSARFVRSKETYLIAEASVKSVDADEARANARLIAAAPEMLAVIKMLTMHSPQGCEDYGVPEARALLARIEG